jgi:hypothetical protein
MDMTIRMLVLPLLSLVDDAFGKARAWICGDNKAMLRVMETGRNPTMRHLTRTHRICVAWLHEQHKREDFHFDYVKSHRMVADMYTKSIPSPSKWDECRKSIHVYRGQDVFLSVNGMSLPDASSALCGHHAVFCFFTGTVKPSPAFALHFGAGASPRDRDMAADSDISPMDRLLSIHRVLRG